MKNLLFERASIVFNLAALYSQLAGTEDRSNSQGIRRAINHYQACSTHCERLAHPPDMCRS